MLLNGNMNQMYRNFLRKSKMLKVDKMKQRQRKKKQRKQLLKCYERNNKLKVKISSVYLKVISTVNSTLRVFQHMMQRVLKLSQMQMR